MNPQALKITGGKGVTYEKNDVKRGFKPFDKKTIISKTSKYYNGHKFLLSIAKIERTIDN